MNVKPMRFHGPGWVAKGDRITYMVWAPQDGTFRPRTEWMASRHQYIVDDDDDLVTTTDSDFVHGTTMDDVLSIFPAHVRALFLKAIQGGEKTA